MASGLDYEVDHNGAGFALHVTDVEPLAVALLKLTQQGQGIMVVDEAHGFARMQGIQGTAGTPAAGGQPVVTSDIIKVPSKAELEKGAKIEVIKADEVEKLKQEAASKPAGQ